MEQARESTVAEKMEPGRSFLPVSSSHAAYLCSWQVVYSDVVLDEPSLWSSLSSCHVQSN